jgi:hypothetical protein
VSETLHACAWEEARGSCEMTYVRRLAEYPKFIVAVAEQRDGPPRSWDAPPDHPRATWRGLHPITGESAGCGFDGIVPAMEAADAKLAEWGLMLLGDVRRATAPTPAGSAQARPEEKP